MKRGGSKRPTLGFLIDWTDNPCQYAILQGLAGCAAARDVNLICFEGGALHCPLDVSGSTSLNAPYDLAGPETVDGLVILAMSIGRCCTPRQLNDFCGRYRPLPMVATGREVDGVPSVVIDNEAGLVQLLEHLLRDHEYTRIAFVNGTENHPDAIQRRAVFERTVQAHGVSVRPELMVDGDFMPDSGARAVTTLLDARKAAFEVLVAANDYMAIGATQELTRRGIAVPVDVAVTGFDDLDLSSTLDPPLTTVAQPLREQGRIACEMVLDLLAGREVPDRRVLPTNLVIRDSCWLQCSLTVRSPNEWRSSSAPQPGFARIRSEALADVVEAMASHRPYRPALGLDRALQEISEHRGTRYDLHAVDVCLRPFNQQGYRLRAFGSPA